jgi:hypothetical protein
LDLSRAIDIQHLTLGGGKPLLKRVHFKNSSELGSRA